MCNLCPLKSCLQLKLCLSTLGVDPLNFLMDRIKASLLAIHYKCLAANDCTDLLHLSMFRTKAKAVTLKRGLAIVDCTTWPPDSDSIYDNSRHTPADWHTSGIHLRSCLR